MLPAVPEMQTNFIKVKGQDGTHIHTARFPNINQHEKPLATLYFVHGFGSYLEKYNGVIKRF